MYSRADVSMDDLRASPREKADTEKVQGPSPGGKSSLRVYLKRISPAAGAVTGSCLKNIVERFTARPAPAKGGRSFSDTLHSRFEGMTRCTGG